MEGLSKLVMRKRLARLAAFAVAALTAVGIAEAAALNRISVTTVADYKAVPTTSVESAPPLVMLAMSKDEQLYVKAYTDYSDLDNDGNIDTTYQNAFNYSGYFDAGICYGYVSGRFQSASSATASSADLAATPPVAAHRCTADSTQWSGNFLNWLTMTRLDVVRSVLYGGLRQTDTTSSTILERAYVPTDVHAWAKVYSGSDVADFTPYTAGQPISFCNVSLNDSDTESATSDAVPFLRVARGNFTEWATTEVKQCFFRGEYNRTDNAPAGTITPDQLNVRVEVCRNVAGVPNEGFCRPYVNGATTTLKPAGLLQRYGEDGQLRFGLVTGSYSRPRSGGQLRKNINRFANVDGDTNVGCETGDEVDLNTGVFCTAALASGAAGVVNTLNRLRVSRWSTNASDHTDCPSVGTTNRQGFSLDSLDNPGAGGTARACNSWGNPLSEIYAEALRYFSTPTAQATPGFLGTEPSLKSFAGSVAGVLPTATWTDPLSAQTFCADCSIVLISTGLNSFDTDEIPNVAALGTTAEAATDAVGANEALAGQYVVGRTTPTPLGASLDTHTDVCTAKSLPSLSAARGVCPEVPSFEGGYHIAGLAFKGFTQDLRADLQDTQVVQTYAVALAESLPGFTIPVGNGSITLAPACQANTDGGAVFTSTGWRSCALANVSIGRRQATVAPMRLYGRPLETPDAVTSESAGSFFVGWEDSPFGNDRDLDLTTMITYCVGSRCSIDEDGTAGADICFRSDSTAVCTGAGNLIAPIPPGEMLVRVEMLSAVGGNAMLGGFTVSGAASGNGFQRVVLRPGGQDNSLLTGTDADPPGTWSRPKVQRFLPGTTSAELLPNPLLYAAKYGGFNEIVEDGIPTPSEPREWDEINNFTGLDGSDGLPDNYFPVRNPAQLQDRLADIFNDILRRAGSGTAAAVVANAREGEGAIYQALFEPSRVAGNRQANWIGTLHSLWLDGNGFLREDGGVLGTLEESDFSADPVVEIYFDEDDRVTRFRRFTGDPAGGISVDDLPIDDLNTLWNAREQLSSLTNNEALTQRTYTTSAAEGRHIITFLDYDRDGIPDANEVQPFVPGTFVSNSTTGNFGILNVQTTADAARVVNFVRGGEVAANSGLRQRELNYDGSPDGSQEVQRLGDIVQSTPTVVGTPAEAFDLLYSDQTYAQFRDRYRNRRNVVYVGANDGLLHAFNGGFFNAETTSFRTTPLTGTATAHPLGSELWAYAPYNLLPHLTWLTDSDYPHVWYVDGKPRAFDARIFPDDATHPNGWGTVLVVGMRLGGAPITLSRPSSATSGRPSMTTNQYRDSLSRHGAVGTSTAINNFTLTTRSAFIVLDVTNPEVPPTLLAEISSPNLRFTTSFPTAVSVGRTENNPGTPPVNDWYLVFGSGPAENTLTGAPPTAAAGLFLWNLRTRAFESGWNPRVFAADAPASFVGDPVSVDWDLDFKADAIYFGTIGGSIAAPSGRLFKIDIQAAGDLNRASDEARPVAAWTSSVLVNAGAPVTATPAVTFDEFGTRWVFSGTGRFFANDDKPTSTQQYLFGVIDRVPPGDEQDGAGFPRLPPFTSITNLLDVSDARVRTDGTVTGVAYLDRVSGLAVANETELINATDDLGGWRISLNNPTDSSERNVSSSSLLGDILFASAFTPSDDLCLGEGTSRLFGVYFKTGAPRGSLPVFGTTDITVGVEILQEGIRDVTLGAGLAASPSLSLGSGRDAKGVTVFSQTSTGAIRREEGDVTRGARSGETDWRERFE